MLKKQPIHTPVLDHINKICKEENRNPTQEEFHLIGIEGAKNFKEKLLNVFRKK